MKYLFSVLLFLGFIFFSIPSFAGVTNNDASFNLQNQTIEVINLATLPKEVIEDASNQASLEPKVEIIVFNNFFKNIIHTFDVIGCNFLNIIGLGSSCKTDFSVTAQLAADSEIQGQSYLPENMELSPAPKDPDLGDFDQKTSGNDKLDKISENLGTTTGFYGNDQPQLSDYETCVQKRMKEFNFNLNGTSFEKEQRSADVSCRKQVYCQGSYPNNICPFEPPTP